MPTVFIPFWRIRQHAVVEEAVRGGSRRRRTEGSWPLPPELREQLRSLLADHGLEPAREVLVEEPPGQDGPGSASDGQRAGTIAPLALPRVVLAVREMVG